jgi:hypothetical protein
VERFEKQTSKMAENFEHTKKANTDIALVNSTASEINRMLYDLNIDPKSNSRWEKVQTELREVNSAFGVERPAGAGFR